MNRFCFISVASIIFLFLHLVSCELSLKNTFKAHFFGINSLEISNDNDIITTGGGDFNIKIWSSDTFELKNMIHCHNESEGLGFNIKNIVFLESGDLVSASSVYYYGRDSYETRIFYKLWDFNSSKMKTFQNGKSFQEVDNMILLSNGDLAIVTSERILTIRESQSLEIKKIIEPTKIDYVPFAGLIELKNKDLLYGCDGTVNIFDTQFNLKATFNLIGDLRYVIMLKNGDLVTSESDDALRIWDQNSYKLKNTIKDSNVTKGVVQMIQLENEDLVLGTSDGFINVIDSQKFELKQKLNTFDEVLAFNIMKNGDLVSGHNNGTISVWANN